MAGSVMCSTDYLLASISLFMGSSALLAVTSYFDFLIIKELEKCKWCDSDAPTVTVTLVKRDDNGA